MIIRYSRKQTIYFIYQFLENISIFDCDLWLILIDVKIKLSLQYLGHQVCISENYFLINSKIEILVNYYAIYIIMRSLNSFFLN